MDKNRISVIIPAYQPDEKVISTVTELVQAGFADILVINDGSSEACADIFKKIEEIPECTVLVHPVNRGKGAALKTAFTYFLENRADRDCVVTADADGQHLTKDIIAVTKKAMESQSVVLGVRDFTSPDVPARSKAGNNITTAVFKIFFGMRIKDTQTGLRAFPKKYLADILEAEGERYEYETNMLFLMNRRKIPFEQIEIATVYIEENATSHFRVVRDSLRVYGLILKYLFSSTAATVIDELVFYLMKKFAFLAFLPIPLTFSSAFVARAISSLVNYGINAKVVFRDNTNAKTFLRYYLLVVVQIAISAALVFAVENIFQITSPLLSTIVKIVVDTMLFFFSFRIQHKWVFNTKKAHGEETD